MLFSFKDLNLVAQDLYHYILWVKLNALWTFVEGSFRFLGGESQPWPQVYTGQIIQAWKDQEKEGKLCRRSHWYQCVFHQIRQRVENNKKETSCWISYCTYRALYLLLMIFHLHKIFLSWIYVAVLIFWHYHNGLMP